MKKIILASAALLGLAIGSANAATISTVVTNNGTIGSVGTGGSVLGLNLNWTNSNTVTGVNTSGLATSGAGVGSFANTSFAGTAGTEVWSGTVGLFGSVAGVRGEGVLNGDALSAVDRPNNIGGVLAGGDVTKTVSADVAGIFVGEATGVGLFTAAGTTGSMNLFNAGSANANTGLTSTSLGLAGGEASVISGAVAFGPLVSVASASAGASLNAVAVAD